MLNDVISKFKSQGTRVQIVAIGDLLFSVYYFYLFIASFFVFDELPILNLVKNGVAFVGMLFGFYFLLQGKPIGKSLTRFVGVVGSIYFIGYVFYGITFIGKPGYSEIVVISYTIGYTSDILIRFAYPIIAGFLILNKPNDELGLM
jgi:hypothetical protein